MAKRTTWVGEFWADCSLCMLHADIPYTLPLSELWRHTDFSRWRPAAILDLIWIILDHPRSAIVGLWLILKFGLDRIYSFGDIAIFIFCRFGLKWPIHALFGGFGGIFPQMTLPIVVTPKRHFLTRKHVGWAINHENRFSGSTWVHSREKKDRTGKKVTKW